MTNQEVFNKVVDHLRKQNAKSIGRNPIRFHSDEEYCLYRGTNGLKCAAGCLIPDCIYEESFETGKFSAVMSRSSELNVMYQHNYHLILMLQNIHDICEIKDWEVMFEITARKFNLKFTSKESKK